jgi:transposase
MHKEVKFYLGIDVSKLWFDLSLMVVADHHKQPVKTLRFDNTGEGIKEMDKWLIDEQVVFNDDCLLVMENTGVYHRLLWQYCSDHNLAVHIGNAARIKWSLGITRGKNDTIDSRRLCDYAFRHADQLKATPVLNSSLLRLKDLITSRSRLVAQLTSIKVYLGELKAVHTKDVQKILEQSHRAALSGIQTSIKVIETRIMQIVKEHSDIENNYRLLLSVPGIGHFTAVYIICCTNNFISKINGKQLASYAGVAPFASTSGTSVKGRNKVHKMANKDLKKMLHLCALAAIRYYPEFKDYYERKKAEGKHSLAVMNAVKNKIALRAAAVINNQKEYVNNYTKTA